MICHLIYFLGEIGEGYRPIGHRVILLTTEMQ